jgi:hypothetical protein
MLGDTLITNDDTQLLVEDLDNGMVLRPTTGERSNG